jgi:hypothetical protein
MLIKCLYAEKLFQGRHSSYKFLSPPNAPFGYFHSERLFSIYEKPYLSQISADHWLLYDLNEGLFQINKHFFQVQSSNLFANTDLLFGIAKELKTMGFTQDITVLNPPIEWEEKLLALCNLYQKQIRSNMTQLGLLLFENPGAPFQKKMLLVRNTNPSGNKSQIPAYSYLFCEKSKCNEFRLFGKIKATSFFFSDVFQSGSLHCVLFPEYRCFLCILLFETEGLLTCLTLEGIMAQLALQGNLSNLQEESYGRLWRKIFKVQTHDQLKELAQEIQDKNYLAIALNPEGKIMIKRVEVSTQGIKECKNKQHP